MEYGGEDSRCCQNKHLHLLSSSYHGCHICPYPERKSNCDVRYWYGPGINRTVPF